MRSYGLRACVLTFVLCWLTLAAHTTYLREDRVEDSGREDGDRGDLELYDGVVT